MHAYLREDNQYRDTLEWDHRVVCQGWSDPTEFGQMLPRQLCSFCQDGVTNWIDNNPGPVEFIRMKRTGLDY